MTLCQPSGDEYGDGKLLSKLRDGNQWALVAERWSNESVHYSDRANSAHLIFSATRGTISDESENVARNISATSGHGAWTDVSYLSLDTTPPSYVNLSVTLCYPAIWTARLNVTLQSSRNRTEPVVSSSFDTSFRTTPDIHAQMGEFKHKHEKAYAIRSRDC